MKFAVIDERAVVIDAQGVVDVCDASSSQFGPDAQGVYERWPDFVRWSNAHAAGAPHTLLRPDAKYGAPSPRPRQVFGIGMNYADHATEAGFALPDDPLVFTKFASCIAGASEPLRITVPTVDWEVELVVIVGRSARNVARADAWSFVAGLTIGQDISDRTLQMAGANPQFSLGKSRPGYGPIGPWLVTPDEFANRDDLEIGCSLGGEPLQHSRTRHLIHDVAALVSYLASVLTLWPGDVIFTGTPGGVGFKRKPPRYLAAGDTLVSAIEGIGELHTRVVDGRG